MLQKSIFKSNDIRGTYPDEIDEEAAYEIGKAFAEMTSAQKVAVGRDMRLGSPALHRGLLRGLTKKGVDVHDIGLVPIDAVYFAVGTYGYDAGVMITASHNPKQYAGMKMVGKGVSWIRGKDILAHLESPKEDAAHAGKTAQGKTEEKDIYPVYIRHILSRGEPEKIKLLTVVVDAGNGMAGKVMPLLAEHLPCKIIPLFFDLDGNFPNRPSNPLEPGAPDAAIKKVLAERADAGVMFDGDTDRLFFIDERGNFIRGDMTLLLIARHMLRRYPGAGIAYNLICSKAVPEFVKKWGGKPLRTAVGYVNVGKTMKERDGVMGGELSAHYSFKDNFYADSGFIALLIVLQTLSESGKKMSELVEELGVYKKSDEVNLTISDKARVIREVKEKYKDGKQDDLDGVTVEYPDWWFNVRASNTEPLLRVTAEADTEELLEKNKSALLSFIASLGQ